MDKAQNKRAERARRKLEGWIRFECWIKPAWADKIKRFIAKLG